MDFLTVEKHDNRDYFVKVYIWMFLAMILSGLVSYYLMNNFDFLNFLDTKTRYRGELTSSSLVYLIFFLDHILIPLTLNITNIVQYFNWFFTMLFFFFLSTLTIGVNLTLLLFLTKSNIVSYLCFILAFGYLLSIFFIFIKNNILYKKEYMFGIIPLIITTIFFNYYNDKNIFIHLISIFFIWVFVRNTAHQIDLLKTNNTINDMYTENHLKESFHGAIKIVVEFLAVFLNILISIASWNHNSPSNIKKRYNIKTESDISNSSNYYN